MLVVTRQTLYRIINQQTSVSSEMAIRISKAFGNTPEHWLRLQLAYDVAQMQEKIEVIHVTRYVPQAGALH